MIKWKTSYSNLCLRKINATTLCMWYGFEFRCRRQPYMNVLPYLEIEVACGLNANTCNFMNGIYHNSLLSYGGNPNGQLGCVINFLHMAHSCEYGSTSRFAHLFGPLFLLDEYSLVALDVGHPLEVAVVTAALCQT